MNTVSPGTESELKLWQRDLPPVAGVGRTAGQLTTASIILTAAVGIPLSTLIVAFSLFVTGCVLEVTATLMERALSEWFTWRATTIRIAALSAKSVAALAFILPTTGHIGAWVAQFISWVAHFGKTRSMPLVRVAGTVSVAAALLLLICLAICSTDRIPIQISRVSLLISFVYFWAVGVLSLFFWWANTEDSPKNDNLPFCEGCGIFMGTRKLPQLSLFAARRAADALKVNDFRAFLEQARKPSGNCATPRLYECPRCHTGFAELMIHFHPNWQPRAEQGVSSEVPRVITWCAAATPVSAKQMKVSHTEPTRKRMIVRTAVK